jgi:GT2 family glycosyltransferase
MGLNSREDKQTLPSDTPSLSVLIPTYNRAEILRQTLRALTQVDRTDINYEIVVIDNNSSDATAEVVKQFQTDLYLCLLTEARPGKNCALNKALRECTLKDIVVFTDDDVTPAPDWFQKIISAVRRWPRIAVFGGKVEVSWPNEEVPEWASIDWVAAFGFSQHAYADQEVYYRPPACPFGPNFWVRKSVFETIPFFDETIGPRPESRIMGSETSMLMQLQRQGFQMLYCPDAKVCHRIAPKNCNLGRLRRRGFTFGRSEIKLFGLHRSQLYRRSRVLWAVVLALDSCYTGLRYAYGLLIRDPKRNCVTTVGAMIRFGQLAETVNQFLYQPKRI